MLLLILVTYALLATAKAGWTVSLVLFVQIATIWVTLQAALARRRLRQVTTAILVVSAAVGVLNLFLPRGPTGSGLMAVVSGLLYVAAPASSSATWCCDGPWTPKSCWARSPPT